MHDWLTLSMGKEAIEKFTSEYATPGRNIEEIGGGGEFNSGGVVNLLVTDYLSSLNQWFEDSDSKWRLRLAKVDDVNSILRLVRGLAIYEKEPDAVHMTAEQLTLDGFSTDNPLFHCLLLDYHGPEKDDDSILNTGVRTCGMAFFYFGHRLDEGRFLYLEDLFIEEDCRKFGGGKLAMQALGRISQIVQCNRMVWQALDWNTPALDFYRKIGARVEEGLLTTRYSDRSLVDFSME
jgi:GNAT superfamily N-acetyltransferase